MKQILAKVISPYLILFLVLSTFIPVATMVTPDEVSATISDNVTLLLPTTALPSYVKSEGTLVTQQKINADALGFMDVRIQLFAAGETTTPLWTSTNYAYNVTVIGDQTFYYSWTMPTAAAVPAATYGIRVMAQQPQGTETWKYSAIQTAAVVIDNTVPSAPTALSPNGVYTNDNTTFLSWNCVTKGTQTILYGVQVDNTSTSFTSSATRPVDVSGIATCNYTTAAIPDGQKYWRVRAVDNATNTSAWSSVLSYFIDTFAPAAGVAPTLSSPADGATIGGSYNPSLTWVDNITDPTPSSGLRYWVQVASDAGFTTLAENVTTITNVTYTPGSTLAAGTWYWHVKARDMAWNETAWSTTRSFIKPTSTTSYSLPMGTGWNLMSLPLCPGSSSSMTAANFVAACDNGSNAIDIIWGYYPEETLDANKWKWYIPGATGNTLSTIEVTRGYWVNTTSPTTLSITGASCPNPPYSALTATLLPGWNLIGFKSTTNILAGTYLGACAANISFVCRYPAGWDCGTPAAITCQPGQGYWVFLGGTANCSYGLPCN